MLDAKLRPLIDPSLNACGRWLARKGVSADSVTIGGFVLGISGALAIALSEVMLGLALIVLSRIADGLDGAVARATRKTDLGGFLDIVLDFIFYGAVPLAFAIANPAQNALPAAVLIMGFLANSSAFLTFAIMAERRGLAPAAKGPKSLYYMAGLFEGAETIAILIAFCLLPDWFPVLAYGAALVCFASAAGRILLAWRTLDPAEDRRADATEPLSEKTAKSGRDAAA